MTKRAIPAPTGNQTEFNKAVKENLETIMGQRTGRLQPLASTASTDDIIAMINRIIERLQ